MFKRQLLIPLLAALAEIHAQGAEDLGTITCDRCEQRTPKLDAAGSFHCTCGHAVLVDVAQPPPDGPSP